jgi:hypothetical protein
MRLACRAWIWGTDLHGVESEDVGRQRIEVLLLPLAQVTADGRLQPGGQVYNFRVVRSHSSFSLVSHLFFRAS